MNAKTKVLQQLADEAQHVAKTARVDLDGFLALGSEERAARWRGFDRAAKFQVVAQMCSRKYGDWDQELVELWIAKYDAKWGAEMLPTEAAVAGALERLAETHQQSALHAPSAAERTYFRRWSGAFRKALLYWQHAVRPEQTPGGAWLVASATRAGQVHRVSRDGQCSCEAHDRGCWHAALVTGIEVGYEDLDRFDHAAQPTAADLGKRLAARRACYLVAA